MCGLVAGAVHVCQVHYLAFGISRGLPLLPTLPPNMNRTYNQKEKVLAGTMRGTKPRTSAR